MKKLEYFTKLLTGNFDNREQFDEMKKNGILFVYAKHKNTVLNNKIENLPNNFEGVFVLEESIYDTDGKTRKSPHIFLFTQKNEDIVLESFQILKRFSKDEVSFDDIDKISYEELERSEKFTPAIFKEKDGIFEGKSTSMFSPSLRFELAEKFSKDYLEVSEKMYLNSKMTFGYDYPIIYKRIF